jgi:hypothetical protein
VRFQLRKLIKDTIARLLVRHLGEAIYDSEINAEIRWFWDGGFTVRLGDQMNGFLAEEDENSVAEIRPWLQEAIVRFYPDSDYAQSLEPAGKGARGGPCLSPSADRSAGALPALRVAERQCGII